nr:unnamed protein product [Digitaria exilis]
MTRSRSGGSTTHCSTQIDREDGGDHDRETEPPLALRAGTTSSSSWLSATRERVIGSDDQRV